MRRIERDKSFFGVSRQCTAIRCSFVSGASGKLAGDIAARSR
jgi:hypothetical protein